MCADNLRTFWTIDSGKVAILAEYRCTKHVLQKVASALLSRGRLSLPQLVRFTSLKPRMIRASVIILVQHNLVWHSQSDNEEVLEFNVEECLLRLRFGKFVRQTEQLFGSAVS